MSRGVQACFCRGMIYNSFVYGMFCDLYMYSFSYEFFCKSEDILKEKNWEITKKNIFIIPLFIFAFTNFTITFKKGKKIFITLWLINLNFGFRVEE